MSAALAWALGALPGLAPGQFDLVAAYHERVKGFEAIYYLEEDATWARDRRVFELFGTINFLERNPETEGFGDALLHWNAGLLVNVRPGREGKVQLTLFSLANQLRFLVNDVTEMLHGARVTLSNLLEVSAGGYWLLENTRATFGNGEASAFLEVNLPFLFAKSSYVLGTNPRRPEAESLLRFDARLAYDQLRFVDDVELEVTRYDLTDAENVLVGVGFVRLGTNDVKLLSGEASWSTSEGRFAHGRLGLDLLGQLGEDFNATRRGHFGTSFRLEAYGTYVSPLGYRRFRPRVSLAEAREGVLGATVELTAQIPAKWLGTALLVIGSVGAASMDNDPGRRQRLIQDAANLTLETAKHPEDELFTRLILTYAYNDPVVLEMFPGSSGQHRLFATLGIMY